MRDSLSAWAARFSLFTIAFGSFCSFSPIRAADADAASPAPAAHLSAAPLKHELTSVVEGQLAAFRAHDYAKAYSFAASEIQGQFGPAEFEQMVKSGFPAIAQSTSATFGLAFDTGEEAVMVVKVENDRKESVEYQYLLKKQKGQWKIIGVSPAKSAGLQV